MKFLFKYTFHLAILACVSALFSGCEQDPKYRVYDYPVPVVESIYPTDGYVTTQVVITGTNFGDRAEAVKVFFGEAQSNKVLDCKNNRLVVEVPETAVTGNLSLQIYNKKVENIGHQDPAGFQALSGGRRRALRSLGQAAAGSGLRRRGRGCGERRAPVR